MHGIPFNCASVHPGDLPAVIVPDGLINPAAASIDVVIPPYHGMQPGDRILLSWGHRHIGLPPLALEQVGEPVTIKVNDPAEGLEADPDVQVSWQRLGRDGEWSGWSPPLFVTLPSTRALPPSPWVEGTFKDEGAIYILHPITPDMASVRVEGHGAVPRNQVVVRCRGMTFEGKPLDWQAPPCEIRRKRQTLDIDLPAELMATLPGGSLLISYDILAEGQVPIHSRSRRLRIEGSPEPLRAPAVEQADGAILDPLCAKGGASVQIGPWPGMAADDECELIWAGTDVRGVTRTFRDTATGGEAMRTGGLAYQVPSCELANLNGGLVRLTYRIRTFGAVERDGVTERECVGAQSAETLVLRVHSPKAPPSTVTDDLNGLSPRQFERLKRPQFHMIPLKGAWRIRNGLSAIRPFHDGSFVYTASDRAALRVAFHQPCTSVRFGYGAGGTEGNGSVFHVEVLSVVGTRIAELSYQVPVRGLPGMWIDLNAADFGEPIGTIVVRKDTSHRPGTVTALLDNFTMCW